MWFYVAIVIIYMTQQVDGLLMTLAWAYVCTRILHTGIHLTHNKVRHRMWVFILSYALLVTLWGWLFIKLAIAE